MANEQVAPKNASEQIDQYLLKGAKIKEFESIDDITFVRRIYLEAIGRIPRPDEIKAFQDNASPEKREEIVRVLLRSEEYASYMYHFYADLFRIKQRIRGDYKSFYESWLKNALKKNMPYDKMVQELINSKGHISENGATGYYLRDNGQPLEIASTTAQVFLGTQIGCAQCHDHPFESWTQKQFYEFASYLSTVETANNKGIKAISNQLNLKELEPKERNALRSIIEDSMIEISDNPRKKLRLPDDYKYDNAKPKDVVSPKVFIGNQPDLEKYESHREAFSYWLTDKNNPRFTKIIVNRLWKRTMGRGLFEPIDDYNDDILVHYPELLSFLEKLLIDLNYDVRAFQEILYTTKHYQVPSSDKEFSQSIYDISLRPLSRMQAEQVWNSVLVIARKNFENAKSTRTYSERDKLVQYLKEKKLEDIEADKENILNTVHNITNPQNQKKQSEVAITTMSSMMAESPMTENEPKAIMQTEIAHDTIKPKETKVVKSKKELMEEKLEHDSNVALKDFRGRSSDIKSPAPSNHILNYFGQSEKDIIKEGDLSPNLPQVLALINDKVSTNLIVKYSLVKRNVNKLESLDEKIDYLYLSILNRYPSTAEKQTSQNYLQKENNQKIEDMIWVLINTREFLFIQ